MSSRQSALIALLGAVGVTEPAIVAILDNEAGQHFVGSAHTLANFGTASYRSTTADNASYEQLLEESSLDAAQRANATWKAQPASYEPPPIDEAIEAELIDYIARRKAGMPDEIG